MNPTPPPPANGYGWRVAELERRMAEAERASNRVAVIETKLDNLISEVREDNVSMRAEVVYLRRVLLGLLVSITLAAVVFGLTQLQ